jgi:predicted GIY-YIG superfamily endonuclease
MIIVYCLVFPNGKKYVGVTNNFTRRIKTHKYIAKTGKHSFLVHKAIKKYGPKNIMVRKLGYFVDINDALKREREFIKLYQSNEKLWGYNLTLGGEYHHNKSVMIFSEEHREKIAKTLNGKVTIVFKNEKEIGRWINLNKCAEDLKLYRGNITHCLKGKLKSTGGYTFKYEDPI